MCFIKQYWETTEEGSIQSLKERVEEEKQTLSTLFMSSVSESGESYLG